MSTPDPDQVAPAEVAIILQFARNCLSLAGDFVEFGCYRGDTSVQLAKVLSTAEDSRGLKNPRNPEYLHSPKSPHDSSTHHNAKPPITPSAPNPKRLWLYDSFAGLPAKSTEDASAAGTQFRPGALTASKRELLDRFRRASLPRPVVRKAFFDQLQPADLPESIAFAFLDGDLYNSIKTSLHLVWSRLTPGAVVIVHDYNNPELPGATRAVDEFLAAHPARLTVQRTLAIITSAS